MKSFKSLMESLAEAWPGTPEYKKKFGSSDDGSEGSRHKIDRSAGITRATRKYDSESGESEEPTKSREDAAAAPVKRGRGRPPGKYGSYKKKVKESIEILEALETDEEIEEFVFSLDEESFAELEQYLSEEQVDEALKGAMHPDAAKVLKHIKPEHHSTYKPHLKQGVYKGNYSDRAAVLRAAEKAGHIKEDAELDEKYMGAEKLASSLAAKGAKDPKALAAWIGRKKYGKEAFQKAAAKGEKMSEEAKLDEELKGGQHRIDVNKNGKLDAADFKKLRTMKKKPDGTLHNCATHVEHAVYGKGECIKEEHAAPDEAGNIAWYTVKFTDGSVRKMQTESMKIVVSESHKHESVEVQVDESVSKYAAFISTENK